ncbi:uncharacterized protein LOC110447012 [Mizuhopecten yessoensis]|uniref:Tyrosyl-DNA phosphodiesterase 1 n=1 Tax=Mizuhopecten yessoensis TaxID=6573 RepID=A0A210QW30_MIZYE|nr:uncharacterized protein LOC110447012 [Mizuhopecten yessoensis]OWF52978.1 hypothetical protein KP79_PYT16353 [Mizuhopecten yessoensis]
MEPIKRKLDSGSDNTKNVAKTKKSKTKESHSSELEAKKIKTPEEISIGRFVNGRTDIYPVWQSLLQRWFSESSTEVYIVTPFMDLERLYEICFFMLENQSAANLRAIYVREISNVRVPKKNPPKFIPYWKFGPGYKPDDPEAYGALIRAFLDAFSPKYRSYVKEHVISKLTNPKSTFHGKFAAGVKANSAQVLITSANFQGHHFDHNNYETVCYSTMTKLDFEDRFLNNIQIE